MRALVALLLLANLGFFALAQGWLRPYAGLSGAHEREPQRLAAQIDAASVRVLAAGAAASAPDDGCFQAGPFGAGQIDALAASLHAAATWQRLPAEMPAAPGAAASAPQWLRVEGPDAALRQQLQALAAATPGASVSACAPPR